MGRLVYHNLSGIPGQFSPFDKAILEVASSGSIDIVSPYIGVDYLERIIQVSNEWRLISDVEAWLSSLSIRARPKAWLFIRNNLERIHHCPAIHAKAVISKQLAMFGSANLTNSGILNRTEMGILIDDPTQVSEIGTWFCSLWQQTLPPVADETNALIQWLDQVSEQTPVRREKLSLSAKTKKVRARLIQLPSPPREKGTQLDLGSVAQTLLLQEQRHYDSLEEAVEAAINHLATSRFTFRQLVEKVRQGFPLTSIREIYFALLPHCANHVRSVFSENTRNRLILKNNTFIQSERDAVLDAFRIYDSFLKEIIHHFDFYHLRDLPNEDRLKKLTGVSGNDQATLISELIESNFLELEDVAGHLPRYKLTEDFEWEGRYKLFAAAMHDWIAKKNAPHSKIEHPPLSKEDDADLFSEERDPDQISDKALRTAYAKVEAERQKKIDKILSNLLLRIFSGEKVHITKSLPIQLSEETGVNVYLASQVISGKYLSMPEVILVTHEPGVGRTISVHPKLNWSNLVDYPLTREVCKNFLAVK